MIENMGGSYRSRRFSRGFTKWCLMEDILRKLGLGGPSALRKFSSNPRSSLCPAATRFRSCFGYFSDGIC
jgi:hypothetical protein